MGTKADVPVCRRLASKDARAVELFYPPKSPLLRVVRVVVAPDTIPLSGRHKRALQVVCEFWQCTPNQRLRGLDMSQHKPAGIFVAQVAGLKPEGLRFGYVTSRLLHTLNPKNPEDFSKLHSSTMLPVNKAEKL